MNRFPFSTLLTSNTDLNSVLMETLLADCKSKKVEKGQYLLRPDERCTHTFYVESGLLKMFSIDNKGKEHILQFAPEGWFISDRESSFFKKPSSYFIQAIEDCEVLLLEEALILRLSSENPSFIEFNNRLLHNHIRHLQHRINLLLSATAEERYLDFIKLYPDILVRVPQVLVASYLGIAPESLSRVRKEMAHRHTTR
jgi:CRP-like cAMP-binding protein